jgi:hypothetical protein
MYVAKVIATCAFVNPETGAALRRASLRCAPGFSVLVAQSFMQTAILYRQVGDHLFELHRIDVSRAI